MGTTRFFKRELVEMLHHIHQSIFWHTLSPDTTWFEYDIHVPDGSWRRRFMTLGAQRHMILCINRHIGRHDQRVPVSIGLKLVFKRHVDPFCIRRFGDEPMCAMLLQQLVIKKWAFSHHNEYDSELTSSFITHHE